MIGSNLQTKTKYASKCVCLLNPIIILRLTIVLVACSSVTLRYNCAVLKNSYFRHCILSISIGKSVIVYVTGLLVCM